MPRDAESVPGVMAKCGANLSRLRVHPSMQFGGKQPRLNHSNRSGQHPLDPNPNYQPKPIRFSINRATPAGPDDPCRLSRPENARGFINTERYFQ